MPLQSVSGHSQEQFLETHVILVFEEWHSCFTRSWNSLESFRYWGFHPRPKAHPACATHNVQERNISPLPSNLLLSPSSLARSQHRHAASNAVLKSCGDMPLTLAWLRNIRVNAPSFFDHFAGAASPGSTRKGNETCPATEHMPQVVWRVHEPLPKPNANKLVCGDQGTVVRVGRLSVEGC